MTVMTATISEPGVYDLDAHLYHDDPVPAGSLSSSGARRLLPPSCPALFKHERDHSRQHRSVFDIGHAAHKLVLGTGPELHVVDAADWRTKAARDERAEAHSIGAVPLLRADHDRVQAMAEALRQHPTASALFDPDLGRPEQSLFWTERMFPEPDVWRRARLDWLPDPRPGRTLLVDYKTCQKAAPKALSRAVAEHGYHQQAAWYLDGAQALDLADDDAAFLFCFQEKTPPYLVQVIQLDGAALRIGRKLNRDAIDLYSYCTTTNRWPSYTDDKVEYVSLPAWYERQHEENPW